MSIPTPPDPPHTNKNAHAEERIKIAWKKFSGEPLPDPPQEDTRKVHAEINQLINHRFLVVAGSVTAFGVFAGLIVKESASVLRSQLLSISAIVLLCILRRLMSAILQNIRLLAGYLAARQISSWELEYQFYWMREKDSQQRETYEWSSTVLFKFMIFSLFFVTLPAYWNDLLLPLTMDTSWSFKMGFMTVVKCAFCILTLISVIAGFNYIQYRKVMDFSAPSAMGWWLRSVIKKWNAFADGCDFPKIQTEPRDSFLDWMKRWQNNLDALKKTHESEQR